MFYVVLSNLYFLEVSCYSSLPEICYHLQIRSLCCLLPLLLLINIYEDKPYYILLSVLQFSSYDAVLICTTSMFFPQKIWKHLVNIYYTPKYRCWEQVYSKNCKHDRIKVLCMRRIGLEWFKCVFVFLYSGLASQSKIAAPRHLGS